MAGGELTAEPAWLVHDSEGAPGPLRQGAARYFARHSGPDAALGLAAAAREALDSVLQRPGGGDRGAALELLVADALITLALKARAREDPARLGEFAAALRAAGMEAPMRSPQR